MRFGVMTLIIWILSKIFKRKVNWIYWFGIIIAALLFALAHFPVAFQALTNPSSSLLIYILIGNSIGGIIFGWLYWKKGLESAFIGHLITHIVLLSFELIFK
jgi:membrane protease YdiL (CAAX protease family)